MQKFIAFLSELRSNLTTNQPMTPLILAHSEFDCDVTVWNDELKGNVEGETQTFFNSSFLLSETYIHRKLNQALAQTLVLFEY